ncbi:MAG: two-component regulator propeller domain-containing protein [Ignavibacteria bacterium]
MKKLLLILFGLTGITFSQIYNFHYYNSSNGLNNTSIKNITQDEKGYIWIGTNSSLFRYDGYLFEDIGNWSNSLRTEITGIASFKNQIWISTTSNGIFVLKGENQIQSLNQKLQFLPKKIKKLRRDKDRLILISKDNEFFSVTSDSQATKILSDANLPLTEFNDIVPIQNGYAIASDAGLLIFQYNRIKYTFNQYKAGRTFQAKAVALDKHNNIVFLTNSGGIYKIDNYQLVELHSFNKIYTSFSLIVDQINSIWAGFDDGILRIENSKKDYIGFANGLPHQFVTDIFEDREGNIWIGTLNGIAKLNSLAIQNYPSLFPKVTSAIHKIFKSKNEILIFSDEGISIFNPSGKSFSNIQFNFSHQNKVNDVLEISNSVKLIGTNNGILVLQGNRITPSPLNLQIKTRKILSLALDSENKIYVGTDSGLYVFQSNKIKDYFSIDDILPGNEVNALHITKSDEVYIGTDNGLVKLSDESVLVLRTGNGLINNYVTSLSEDDEGRIWIGTKKGLSSFKNGRFNNFTPKFAGVSVNEIDDAIPVRKNEIWMATPKGIFIVKNGVQYLVINSKDGILSDYITDLEYDPQTGIVFIGTNSGLSTIELKYLKENHFTYRIYFTGFSTNKRTYNLNKIDVPGNEQELKINVSIFSFFDEKKIIYRYRIKEIEESWNYLTNGNTIVYKNLSPGNYTLVVQASVDGINWLQDSAELKFSIKSSFWKNMIYVISGIVGLFFLYSVILFFRNLYRKKKSKLEFPELEREKILSNRPQQVETQVRNTQIEIEEIKKRLEEKIENLKAIIIEKEKVIEQLKMENKSLKEKMFELDNAVQLKNSESDNDEFVEKSRIEIIVKNSSEAEDIKKYIEALEKTNWNIRAAAKLLNIPHSTFHYRLKRLNLLKNK